MELEDRKKKLAAGKEKLAAFRKKRAKKKKADTEGESVKAVDLSTVTNVSNGISNTSLGNLSALSDTIAITGDSDQYSMTSGDEWSAEESETSLALKYQTKLVAATQRIAELEEAVEGKQLALDMMVEEMHKHELSHSNPVCSQTEINDPSDVSSGVKATVSEMQDALLQRDKIIRHLTTHLQETVTSRSVEHMGTQDSDISFETQHLSQQVIMLQQQLTQVGETVQQQAAVCQMSVHALHEARLQILSLQDKVAEKNSLLQELTQSLADSSAEVMAQRQREAEMVHQLGQAGGGLVDTEAARRISDLEAQLEGLHAEHAHSLKNVACLKEQLSSSEAMFSVLAREKEDAIEKISGLEEELDLLGKAKNEALKKMLELEQQVLHDSVLLQDEADAHFREANKRIAQLQQQVADLSETRSNIHLDMLEDISASGEKSQPEKLDSFHQQLERAQMQITIDKETITNLQLQLEDMQSVHKLEQEKSDECVLSLQQQVQALQEEKEGLNLQLIGALEQIGQFKATLENQEVKQAAQISDSTQGLEAESVSLSCDILLLHNAFKSLLCQYGEALQANQDLQAQAQSSLASLSESQGAAATVAQLKEEVEQLRAEVGSQRIEAQQNEEVIKTQKAELKKLLAEKGELATRIHGHVDAVERLTFDSDTLQRKMESRVNSLFSEVAEYKEALKESELANMDLQQKLENFIMEVSSLKTQHSTAEDLVTQLQADMVEKEEQIEKLLYHQQEVARLEDNLLQKSQELEELMSTNEEVTALLASVQDTHSRQVQEHQEMLDTKAQELNKLESEKTQIISDLSLLKHSEAEKIQEIEELRHSVQKKTKQCQNLTAEKEELTFQLENLQTHKNQTCKDNLTKKCEEYESMVREKDHALKRFADELEMFTKETERIKEELMLKTEECELLYSEKESVLLQVTKQQSEFNLKLEELKETLLQKSQECEIIFVGKEHLREELLSMQAAYTQEKQLLKKDLLCQTQKCAQLENKREQMETEVECKDLELERIQDLLSKAEKELESYKLKIIEMNAGACAKENLIENLNSELSKVTERLMQAEATSEDVSGERQKAVGALGSWCRDLEQELSAVKDEKEGLSSRLQAQADMFKVKEEEMVAENNALNHQLEELKNEMQQTIQKLENELADLQMELQTARSSIETQVEELFSLKKENIHQKEIFESIAESNKLLEKEKEELLRKLNNMTVNFADLQVDGDNKVHLLQIEVEQLKEQKSQHMTDFDKERVALVQENRDLRSQLDLCAAEIERLQQSLRKAETEREDLQNFTDRLARQHDTLQQDFATQLEQIQGHLILKNVEIESLQAQIKDTNTQLSHKVETLQEELEAAQLELEHKEAVFVSKEEELATAKHQVEHLTEEKETLKSNFDCCMEEMSQRATENDNTIRQLQGQLLEASHSLDRNKGQLKDLYESQLSELEDRLAAADLEAQRLTKATEAINTEKERLKESYNSQIAELELTVQAAESAAARLKEQKSKQVDIYEKEIADLKHSYEVQISSVEDSCQSLEKALAKQEALMTEARSRYEQEKKDKERVYESQVSEAYEQVRLVEMDMGRLKRQLGEMHKDHQKELEQQQAAMETQVFDLENKVVMATGELERMRQNLWSLEEEKGGECQALRDQLQKLQALTFSQERQLSSLHDQVLHMSQQANESICSLKEDQQLELQQLEKSNEQLNAYQQQMQEQLRLQQQTHAQELQALKQQHSTELNLLKDKYKKMKAYSHVLQSYMENGASGDSSSKGTLLRKKVELQQELDSISSDASDLYQQEKEDKNRSLTLEQKGSDKARPFEDILNIDDQETDILHADKKSTGFKPEVQGGFEPEPDSLHYLDLAGQRPKASGDYFVEELDAGRNHNRVRARSVPTDKFVAEEDEDAVKASRGSKSCHSRSKSDSGRFYPEVEVNIYKRHHRSKSDSSQFFPEVASNIDKGHYSSIKSEKTSLPTTVPEVLDEESFRTESPPTCLALDAHLPHPCATSLSILLESDPSLPQGSAPCSKSSKYMLLMKQNSFEEMEENVSQQMSVPELEALGGDEVTTLEREALDAEVTRKLQQQKERLEEEWVQKMRNQEVELCLQHERQFRDFKEQTEQYYKYHIEKVKIDTQASFAEAVREMRQSFERKQPDERKAEQKRYKAVKQKSRAKEKKKQQKLEDQEGEGRNLGEIVKQLSEENKELAEVRDVLLEQLALSQTQMERHSLQHSLQVELQAFLSGNGRLSPSAHSTRATGPGPDGDCMQARLDDVDQGNTGQPVVLAVTDVGMVTTDADLLQKIEETERNVTAALNLDLPSSGPTTPTACSEEGDESDVRDRFLEELEEMSQQSGQDLPLEWELTVATVTHPATGAIIPSVFERDVDTLAGTGSIWEVFDGRCPRQDCREVRHRYHNLFRWLSSVCSLLASPSSEVEARGQNSGGMGGVWEQEGFGCEKQARPGDEEVMMNPAFLIHILKSKGAALEALLNNPSLLGEDIIEDTSMSEVSMAEAQLLGKLLKVDSFDHISDSTQLSNVSSGSFRHDSLDNETLMQSPASVQTVTVDRNHSCRNLAEQATQTEDSELKIKSSTMGYVNALALPVFQARSEALDNSNIDLEKTVAEIVNTNTNFQNETKESKQLQPKLSDVHTANDCHTKPLAEIEKTGSCFSEQETKGGTLVRQMAAELQYLQSRCNDLEGAVILMEVDCSRLKFDCEHLGDKNKSLQQNNDSLLEQRALQQQVCSSLQNTIESLQQSFEALQKRSVDLQLGMDSLQQTNVSLNEEVDVLMRRNETQQQEICSQQQKYELQYQSATSSLQQIIESSEHRNKCLQETNEVLLQNIDLLNRENESLQQKIESQQKLEQISISSLKQELDLLQKEQNSLQHINETLQNSNESLVEQVEEFTSLQSALETANYTVERQAAKLEHLHFKCHELEVIVETFKSRQAEEKKQQLESKSLEGQVKVLLQQLAENQAECKDMSSQLSIEKSARQKFEEDKACAEEELAAVKLQQKTLIGECQLLTNDIQKLQMCNKSLQMENNDLTAMLHKEQELYKDQEKEMSSNVQSLRLENEKLHEEVCNLQAKIEELGKTCESVQNEIAEKQTTIVCLKNEIVILKEREHCVVSATQNLKDESSLACGSTEQNKKVVLLQDLEIKYKTQEEADKNLQEGSQTRQEHLLEADRKLPRKSSLTKGVDLKQVLAKLEDLKEENNSLQEKIDVLEDSNRSLADRCQTIQERNDLLEEKKKKHDEKNKGLLAELNFIKDNLQAAEDMNNKLLNKIHTLEAVKDMDGNLREKNKALHEKCASQSEDLRVKEIKIDLLKKREKALQTECKEWRDKCLALQQELKEATKSGQSLREQLHEQSMTLEHVLTEMKHHDHLESAVNKACAHAGTKGMDSVDASHEQASLKGDVEVGNLRLQVSSLEMIISEKSEEIDELKEHMTMMSLQQAAVGSPRLPCDSTVDLKQQVEDLQDELMDKEKTIGELQDLVHSLRFGHNDSSVQGHGVDFAKEVKALQQAIDQKDKLFEAFKNPVPSLPISDNQSSMSTSSFGKQSDEGSDLKNASKQAHFIGTPCSIKMGSKSDKSMESTESLAISSDPDSEMQPGQDLDLVKEMGRLRKDIKRTKAMYANESALFQEALDREPVSQLALRVSGTSNIPIVLAQTTHNDIPDDQDELRKMVVRLLEENKTLTTENLRLQLRIREQEALVVEMEEKLSKTSKDPYEDWQPLFERQLLLLQKQRDELLHQIFERDSGVGLLSSKLGKEATQGTALQQQQEDLTSKIGELEHCHRLLQQRQAELAHCQAEKRHLEQLLLLKDETERQLMRQKRLLEEELTTIENKLQEREATLVEEKARLLNELKQKEMHIFHLQSAYPGDHHFSAADALCTTQLVEIGRPQNASTPCFSTRSQSVQAAFMQQPILSPCFEPEEQRQFEGSISNEPSAQRREAKAHSLPDKDHEPPNVPHEESHLLYTGRRHSTGATGFSNLAIPKDPQDMDRYHREAVERLRNKLQEFEVERETVRISDSQSVAVANYWQRHGRQAP